MNSVFIPLSLEGEHRQQTLYETLGSTELLSQLAEECGALVQAAQKMRRVFVGTTPVSQEQATQKLIEKAADVVLILDMLAELKLIDRAGLRFIGRHKTDRWYARVVKKASQSEAEPVECIDRQKLLESVDAIWDCNDMVFEGNRDRSCHPEDCKGCRWNDTKQYIRKLIANAPAVTILKGLIQK